MSARIGTPLAGARFPGFARPFDLVSEDRAIVGNVLRPSPASPRRLSPAQTSALSEQVLLLTSIPAERRLLVFGTGPDAVQQWLAIYGHLTGDIEFWHHPRSGELARIGPT